MTWADVTIVEVVQETALDRSFVLAVPAEHRSAFDFRPGQYVRVRDPDDPEERDWYFSLSAAPSAEGTLRITVRGKGEAVQDLYAARAGALWRVAAPAGDFLVEAEGAARVVLVGAGSGVTPFRALVEQHCAEHEPLELVLVHSARTTAELLFRGEFAAWAREAASFSYVPTVTGPAHGWAGRRGRVDASLLRTALGDPTMVRLFACGPRAFVAHVHAVAATLGMPPGRLHGEGH